MMHRDEARVLQGCGKINGTLILQQRAVITTSTAYPIPLASHIRIARSSPSASFEQTYA